MTAVACGTFSGLAHWYGAWVECNNREAAALQASWTLVAATAGELFLEGTDDAGFAAVTAGAALGSYVTPPAGAIGVRFANVNMRWWYNGTVATPTVTAAIGIARICVLNPMRFHRLAYERSAGGGASQFYSTALLR